MSSFIPPTDPIELIRRLRTLRPDRPERDPVVIPPVAELSEQYDRDFSDGPSMSAYREHISNMPEYEDYKPSFARRLIGGLVGAGLGARSPESGIKFAQDFSQQPYHQAVSQWNMRTKPLEQAAQIEEYEDRTKRKYIDDARDTALKQQHQQLQQDQQGLEFDRKLIEIERSVIDQMNRGQDRDEDRVLRDKDIASRDADRKARAAETAAWHKVLGPILQQNADTKKNPPPRPTAPLKATPERYAEAYKQAMQELVDNPNMADFINRKNGKFIGFKESAGGLFSAKKKPILSMNGKNVAPAEWVKSRTEEILKRMNQPTEQYEDLGYEP